MYSCMCSVHLLRGSEYQLIAGVSFSPFRYPNLCLPYLDHPWFNCTRSFLKQCWAYLEIPDNPPPTAQALSQHLYHGRLPRSRSVTDSSETYQLLLPISPSLPTERHQHPSRRPDRPQRMAGHQAHAIERRRMSHPAMTR